MIKFKTAHFIAGAVIVTAVALPLVTMAHGNPGQANVWSGKSKTHQTMNANNLVIGSVTAVSGTTLTVTDAKGTVYAIDASGAKIDQGLAGSGLNIANVLVGDKVVVTGPVTGTSETAKTINDRSMIGRNIFTGTVTAVSGSTLSIDTMIKKTKTAYTVDVSAAVLSKGMGSGTTIALADIHVGDRVFAIGSLSGTNIAATSVRDLGTLGMKNKMLPSQAAINHGKMFMGTVTAVNGSTITMSGRNKTVYTVDASAATFTKGFGKTATTITLTDIKVGDRISSSGTLTGTTIAATSVRDQGQLKIGAHARRMPGTK